MKVQLEVTIDIDEKWAWTANGVEQSVRDLIARNYSDDEVTVRRVGS